MDGAVRNQLAHVDLQAEFIVDQHRQLDARDRRESEFRKQIGDPEFRRADHAGDDGVDLLFQHVQRSGDLCLVAFLYLWFGLRKLFFVDLLVLIERNAVDLHRDGRHHIGRLVLSDEFSHRFHVNRLVGDDVSGDVLTAAGLVVSLNGSVLDAGEFADDALDLAELDAEAADLHLTVVSTDKVRTAVAHEAHDIAGAVGVLIARFIRERIADKHLGVLFGTVEVASANLMTGDDQLAGYAERNAAHLFVNDILLHVEQRLADRNAVIQLFHREEMRADRALRRTVDVVKFETARRLDRNQLFTAYGQVMRIGRVREQIGVLPADLRRHERMGDTVFGKVFVDAHQIKADALVDDMKLTAGEQHGVHIEHVRVEAVAGISRRAAGLIHVIGVDAPVAEAAKVVVLQNDALGHAGGTGCVEHDKQIFRIGILTYLLCVGEIRDLVGIQHRTGVIRHPVHQTSVGDQILSVGVADHKFKAFARIAWVERLIAGARFENAERGDRHILTARYQHGHGLVFADALFSQERGDILREPVRLAVGIRTVEVDDRNIVRLFFCLTAEQGHHIGDLIVKFKVILCVEPFKLTVGQHDDLAQLFTAEQLRDHLFQTFEQPEYDLVVIEVLLVQGIGAELAHISSDRQFKAHLCILHRHQHALRLMTAEFGRGEEIALIPEQECRVQLRFLAEIQEGIQIILTVKGDLLVELLEKCLDRIIL